MKRFITSSIIVLVIITSCTKKTNNADVPREIIKSFNYYFKGVNPEFWTTEKDNFKVKFEYNQIETIARFSAQGTLIEIEQEIENSELLHEILIYIIKNYSDKEIENMLKVTKPDGTIMYKIEIENESILFDDQGIFIKLL